MKGTLTVADGEHSQMDDQRRMQRVSLGGIMVVSWVGMGAAHQNYVNRVAHMDSGSLSRAPRS